MKRTSSNILYALVVGLLMWPLGASIYVFITYTLEPATHPSDWPGWDWLFFGLDVGLPLVVAAAVGYKLSREKGNNDSLP